MREYNGSDSEFFTERVPHNIAEGWLFRFIEAYGNPDEKALHRQSGLPTDTPKYSKSARVRRDLKKINDLIAQYIVSDDNGDRSVLKSLPGLLLDWAEVQDENSIDMLGDLNQERDEYRDLVELASAGYSSLPIKGITGKNKGFRQTLSLAAKVAKSNFNVLITGETGTGKELIAQAMHEESQRAGGPCETIICGGIAEGVAESEWFGHKKGAFSGATEDRLGRIHRADCGTVILDEIADLSLSDQARLLRAMQNGELQPVGGPPVKVDIRVIAITNQPLEELMEQGRFRRDLYYRIANIRIKVPPLRDRLDDMGEYCEYILREYETDKSLTVRRISRTALKKLVAHDWCGGNFRELQGVLAQASILCTGEVLEPQHIQLDASLDEVQPASALVERIMGIEDNSLHKRDPNLIAECLESSKNGITTSIYAEHMNCSIATARRDLEVLCEAGIVKRTGEKKGRRYLLA